MFDADGLAFLLWFCAAGLAFIGLAALNEFLQIRAMCKRARKREAMERYLKLVNPRQQP